MTEAEVKNFIHEILREEIKELKEMIVERKVNNGVQDEKLKFHESMLYEVMEKMDEMSKSISELRTELEKRDKKISRWITGVILTALATLISVLSLVL